MEGTISLRCVGDRHDYRIGSGRDPPARLDAHGRRDAAGGPYNGHVDFLDPNDMPPEAWERLQGIRAHIDVATSRLTRVIGIGQQVDVDGVRVELIALEVREVGALLYWKAYPAVRRMLGEINVTVSDDRGTEYTTLPAGGGGGDQQVQGELSVIPAPPPDARIRVQVRGFGAFGAPFPMPIQTPVEGNWEFEFGEDDAG